MFAKTNVQASGGLMLSWGELLLGAGAAIALVVIVLIVRARRAERP
jgi:hypothetical protein